MKAVRSFVNEVLNKIDIEVLCDKGQDFDPVRITMIGPFSKADNFVTRREAEMLRDALVEVLSDDKETKA